jgi:hypothetical protein
LGAGGNFKAIANALQPWFSHQHNARYINDNTLLVFDDGNTREASNPSAHSRGQEWILNEQNKTATLMVNADMGSPTATWPSRPGVSPHPPGTRARSRSRCCQMAPGFMCCKRPNLSIRSYSESTLYSAGILD